MKLLLPLTLFYGLAVILRNKFFDWGILKTHEAGVPVISVGNLSAGGTGKTPLVEYIVGYCIGSGRKVAVLSRGYGRKSTGIVVVSNGKNVLADATSGGDEPVQIARKFPDAVVIAAERRVDAARLAVKDHGVNVIILDDGFQHRYLKRTLDIVVVNARKDTTQDYILPAGMRREPLSALSRAKFVALSKCRDAREMEQSRARMRKWYDGSIVAYRYSREGVFRVDTNAHIDMLELNGKSALSVCGIGDPGSFERSLRETGVSIRQSFRFKDHHRYSIREFNRLVQRMRELNADCLLMTEKDAARMVANREIMVRMQEGIPVYYMRITPDFVHGQTEFLAALDACIGRSTE